ncbi:MAG: bifunctional glutamate N-acetyltransferase/amino-acid acetyltransferase ArgJ [Desulfobacca sp.]|uniref:bifunctional glutamate N-acetyltransferase/amino-acid acetyltransferase ArgJ n=1 Tax=Desulfobacca sp. TaxID=2067990 RepID=UPI0040495A42
MVVPGFQAAAVAAAIKKPGRPDLGLIVATAPAVAAGVFTTNRVKAAPVMLCQRRLRRGQAQAILVNSGNANACTGDAGLRAASATTAYVARLLGLPPARVLPASTGVIGQPLPVDRIQAAIPTLVERLRPEGLPDVAAAIMTTDTFPKTAAAQGSIDGLPITVAGIAKGAGMIHPNLATMLVFLLTDANITAPTLKTALRQGLASSFNRITVDGDTSTNDCVLVLASGAAGHFPITDLSSPAGRLFADLLASVMVDLAGRIVRDGEGAAHVFKVIISGAATPRQALQAARTVALSPLVKTAVAGNDANWGRIMAALGRAGIRLDPQKVDIFIGPQQVVSQGLGLGAAAEQAAQALMATGSFDLRIDLHLGSYTDYYLTCDLTADYVHINADYRS